MNTKTLRRTVLGLAVLVLLATSGGQRAMAVEEAAFQLVSKDGSFEVRDYAPQVLAVVMIAGSLEEAGDEAFRPLFRYISGDNRSGAKIAMTAPVGQERAGVKIPMTAPVGQTAEGDRWAVSFMMPVGMTRETVPEPTDPAVQIREQPPRRMAVVRYSGFWSEKKYRRQLDRLRQWMAANNLESTGDPVWARYNPPFTPWFLRRNEILIPVVNTEPAASARD